MIKVLVTGSNGQLGQSIRKIAKDNQELDFVFTDRSELDITNLEQVEEVFKRLKPDYCINAAAYTAVDRAEEEPDKAFKINASGVRNIALACKGHNVILIHVSTDFVFDGKKGSPYMETDEPNPINVYGKSKLEGEREIQNIWPKHFIVRTSWLYSEFGHNFVKTILRLSKERDEISVVDDQIGSPTYAGDLAEMIIQLIIGKLDKFGLYNFSGEGEVSWHEFAKAIVALSNFRINVKPVSSEFYPCRAIRPNYSVLNNSKIKDNLLVRITQWKSKFQSNDINKQFWKL